MVTQPKKKRKIRIGYAKKNYSRSEFESLIKANFKGKHKFIIFNKIMFAYTQSKYGHRNQWRKNMVRYFEHCKSVALIIMLEFKVFLINPIIVALLHDIIEDSFILTRRFVRKIFGYSILYGLNIITKKKGENYYSGIMNVQKKFWWIILVKLADRLHNIRNILHMSKKFMLRQLRETENIYPNLLEVFEEKVPARFSHLPDYIRKEMDYACNKIRRKLGMKTYHAFKRVI